MSSAPTETTDPPEPSSIRTRQDLANGLRSLKGEASYKVLLELSVALVDDGRTRRTSAVGSWTPQALGGGTVSGWFGEDPKVPGRDRMLTFLAVTGVAEDMWPLWLDAVARVDKLPRRFPSPVRSAALAEPTTPPVDRTRRRRAPLVILAVMLGVVVAVTVVAVVRSAGTGAGPPGSTTSSISADRGWQSTGFVVTAGRPVRVSVIGGMWTSATGDGLYTAGQGNPSYICGVALPAAQCQEPVPHAPIGALVARVGGVVFEVGAVAVLTSVDGGELSLRINDGDGPSLVDNAGSLTVRVEAA